MSATFREVDETMERGLFERRRRAMGVPEGVPSLDAVLRAANEHASAAVPARAMREVWRDESRERSSARARAWSGCALAAACVIAVMKSSPRAGVPATIAADDVAHDAGLSLVSGAAAPITRSFARPFTRAFTREDETEASECTGDHAIECMSIAPKTSPATIGHHAPSAPLATFAAASEGPVCDAPVATLESRATLSCDRDEANRSVMP